MSQLLNSAKLRIVILPLVGVIGTLCALAWPLGYQSFCAGIQGLAL